MGGNKHSSEDYLMKSQAYASNQAVVRVREAVMVRASLEQVGGERGRGRDTQRAKSVTSTICTNRNTHAPPRAQYSQPV